MSALALDGRVVAVTGAGRGLGLAIVQALVDRGAHVIANYNLTRGPLDELAAENPDRITLVQGDVGEESGAKDLAEAARPHGRLDALVHNAGISRDGLVARMSVEDWDEVIRVNLRGAFLATKHALRPMMRRRYGRILYVSSVVATMGNAGQANYAASKAGLQGLANSVSQEYASYNIRTIVLAPGLIDVGLAAAAPEEVRRVKLERTLSGSVSPEDVASTIAFLVGPEADFFNASVLSMDGGVRF